MSEDIEFILVRRDSDDKVEIVKKESFDPTGYSFFQYYETGSNTLEEWVENNRLDHYKKLKENVGEENVVSKSNQDLKNLSEKLVNDNSKVDDDNSNGDGLGDNISEDDISFELEKLNNLRKQGWINKQY